MAAPEIHIAAFPSYMDIFCLFFFIFLGLFFVVYSKIIVVDILEFDYGSPPNRLPIILKALWRVITMKQGKIYDRVLPTEKESTAAENILKIDVIKPLQIEATNCRLNEVNVWDYCKFLEQKSKTEVPVCYPELLFMPLLMQMVLSAKFRLSPLGLIHIRQTVNQFTTLELNKSYDLTAKVKEYRSCEKGIEVDIELNIFDESDYCYWNSVMTLLSRNKMKKITKSVNKSVDDVPDLTETIDFVVPHDTGINYAKISGDWNLHHLYPWTARILQYKQPIAHGMWTLAKTITLLESNGAIGKNNPIEIDAAFKKPLLMPGEPTIKYGHKRSKCNGCWFRVEDKVSSAPFLTGFVRTSNL